MRIFGFPVQFAVVVVVSVALTVFFGAWAADARVEARAQAFVPVGSQLGFTGSYSEADPSSDSSSDQALPEGQSVTELEKEWWENSLLFVCPLH